MHCPRFEQADESNYFVKTSCRIMTMDHHLTLYLLVEGATTRIKNPKAGNAADAIKSFNFDYSYWSKEVSIEQPWTALPPHYLKIIGWADK